MNIGINVKTQKLNSKWRLMTSSPPPMMTWRSVGCAFYQRDQIWWKIGGDDQIWILPTHHCLLLCLIKQSGVWIEMRPDSCQGLGQTQKISLISNTHQTFKPHNIDTSISTWPTNTRTHLGQFHEMLVRKECWNNHFQVIVEFLCFFKPRKIKWFYSQIHSFQLFDLWSSWSKFWYFRGSFCPFLFISEPSS